MFASDDEVARTMMENGARDLYGERIGDWYAPPDMARLWRDRVDVEMRAEHERLRSRLRWLKTKSDPEEHARHNERRRERGRERLRRLRDDPERYARHLASERRRWARLRADPERYARYLEVQRAWKRRWRRSGSLRYLAARERYRVKARMRRAVKRNPHLREQWERYLAGYEAWLNKSIHTGAGK